VLLVEVSEDASDVGDAELPELSVLLDVLSTPIESVVVDPGAPGEVPVAPVEGLAVMVTGKEVISAWFRAVVTVPGALAPAPWNVSVQTAVVLPPIEQTTRPVLATLAIGDGDEKYDCRPHKAAADSVNAHSTVDGPAVKSKPGPRPQSGEPVSGAQTILYVVVPPPCSI
jgi:hypothetical protein